MKTVRVMRVVQAVMVLANVAVPVVVAIVDRPKWSFVANAAAIGVLVLGIRSSTRLINKEKDHGSDRGTEAGSRDPGTYTIHYTSTPFATGGTLYRTPALPAGAGVAAGEVERVQSDMPILAHRVARLCFDGSSRPFGPLHTSSQFGVAADAVCSRPWNSYPSERDVHEAPHLPCSCGFYALPSDIEPWEESPNLVTLMVELSGRVIEHEKGYRAQHQRVIECQIPACRYCGRQADTLDIRDGALAEAVCAAHVAALDTNDKPRVLLAVADLDLPVPVTRRGRES